MVFEEVPPLIDKSRNNKVVSSVVTCRPWVFVNTLHTRNFVYKIPEEYSLHQRIDPNTSMKVYCFCEKKLLYWLKQYKWSGTPIQSDQTLLHQMTTPFFLKFVCFFFGVTVYSYIIYWCDVLSSRPLSGTVKNNSHYNRSFDFRQVSKLLRECE